MNSRERYVGTFGMPQYPAPHVATEVTIDSLRKMFNEADKQPKHQGPVVFVKLPERLLEPAPPWQPNATLS